MKRAVFNRIAFLVLCTFLTGAWFWSSSPPPTPEQASASLVATTLHVPSDWGTPASITVGTGSVLTKNYYVVFDGSGSMADEDCSGGDRNGRIAPARIAMNRFASMLPPDANLGLYVFDANGRGELVPLGHGDANRKAYENAIDRTVAGYDTPLGASLAIAYEALRKQSLKQGGYGEYHILVVTDGGATDEDLMDQTVKKIVASPVILETIGFCIAEGHALNQPGRLIYHNAMNPTDLTKGLTAVLAESTDFSAVATTFK